MAKSQSAISSAKARRVKKELQRIVDRARNQAFNDACRVACAIHPGGFRMTKWFYEAWKKTIA